MARGGSRSTSARRSDGIKAAATMKSRYGSNYFKNIGRKGGSRTDTKPKGFEADRALARIAGARGGRASHK